MDEKFLPKGAHAGHIADDPTKNLKVYGVPDAALGDKLRAIEEAVDGVVGRLKGGVAPGVQIPRNGGEPSLVITVCTGCLADALFLSRDLTAAIEALQKHVQENDGLSI